MTTRKALIERIQSMQLGTQEMLDAAKDDATLIPFNTLFADDSGRPVCRTETCNDDNVSVRMAGWGHSGFYDALELCIITEK